LREMAKMIDYCRSYDLFFETENSFRSYDIHRPTVDVDRSGSAVPDSRCLIIIRLIVR